MTNTKQAIIIAVSLLFGIVALMFLMPCYWVWSSGMHGRAQLNKASYNRQIAIQVAYAKKEAAYNLAEADTIRAHGVARANQIIGVSLQNNEIYLQYLWLQTLEATAGKGQTIYIPTSGSSGGTGVFPVMGNLPVTEATRLTVGKNFLSKP